MTITSHVSMFRNRWAIRFAEAADSCVIKRQTGETLDAGTGELTPTYEQQYAGVCIWRAGVHTDAEAGEQQVELRFGTLLVPYDTDGLQPDDLADITSEVDGDLDEKQLVVRNVSTDTYHTVRRLFCEDNQGG